MADIIFIFIVLSMVGVVCVPPMWSTWLEHRERMAYIQRLGYVPPEDDHDQVLLSTTTKDPR